MTENMSSHLCDRTCPPPMWRTRVWTWHSDTMLPHPYPSDSFSLPPLSVILDLSLCHCCLSSEKHFKHCFIEAACVVCRVPVGLIEKVEVVGEFRNITKVHGPMAFILHEARQWFKASPVPQEAGTTFFSSSSASPGRQTPGLFLGITRSGAIRHVASSALMLIS